MGLLPRYPFFGRALNESPSEKEGKLSAVTLGSAYSPPQ